MCVYAIKSIKLIFFYVKMHKNAFGGFIQLLNSEYTNGVNC